MTVLHHHAPLRRALLVDALVSGATGLLLAAGAGLLAPMLELPEPLLRYAGLVLLPFAVFVAYVATRATITRAATWTVIGINSMWTLSSIALLVTGLVAPNALGYGFVLFQAIVVGVMAEWQWLALRRTTAAAR